MELNICTTVMEEVIKVYISTSRVVVVVDFAVRI